MRVIITGATGFIGRALCHEFHRDYELTALSRNAERAQRRVCKIHFAHADKPSRIEPHVQQVAHPTLTPKVVQWDARTPTGWDREADGAYAIINIAGENLGAGRWNQARKSRILQSRLDSTKAVIEAVKRLQNKPKVVILACAIGYYGPRQDEQLDEAAPPGEGFLADVCRQVEGLADQIGTLGVRCVVIRTGIVLGRDGGALPKLAMPFRFYLGGHLGTGRQWFSWISLEDEVAAIRFLIENEQLRGVFNLTAPQPVTMKEFCRILGKVLNRPVWLNVPAFAVRLALGEMADQMLLSGQRVLPARLLAADFKFKYPDLEKALSEILK